MLQWMNRMHAFLVFQMARKLPLVALARCRLGDHFPSHSTTNLSLPLGNQPLGNHFDPTTRQSSASSLPSHILPVVGHLTPPQYSHHCVVQLLFYLSYPINGAQINAPQNQ